jgi:putative transposase
MSEWVTQDVYPGSANSLYLLQTVASRAKEITIAGRLQRGVTELLAEAWKSVIAKRKNGLQAGEPRYKKRYCTVRYENQAISRSKKNSGRIIPTGWRTGFKLPDGVLPQFATLNHSHEDVFVLSVAYVIDIADPLVGGITASIDLGMNKLATITFSDGSTPLVVDGSWVKSLNQGVNRNNAKKEVRSKKAMWKKRNRCVDHFFHTASSVVIKNLLERGVSELVIGWNEGFKDSPKMGRKNNQRFTSLPLAKFRDMLIYKGRQYGIMTILQEESYTSKSSFIDSDPIPVYGDGSDKHTFTGKRIKRGMYRSSNGTLIHADVNGSYNILRKSKPLFEWCRGMVVMPVNLKFSY